MPGKIVTWRMTSGALIGNGNVEVAIGGTPEQQEFHDFGILVWPSLPFSKFGEYYATIRFGNRW